MWCFGKKIDAALEPETMLELLGMAQQKKRALAATDTWEILNVLDRTGQLWHSAGPYYEQALAQLPQELSFSKDMIARTLDLIPALLSRSNLKKRIELELGNLHLLDEFKYRENYRQEHKFSPLGVVAHISAGNVFLGCIDSLVMGFLTKNINILKLSSQNQIFPELFAQSVRAADPGQVLMDKFAMCYWQGGDSAIENIVKKNVQGILCWGGAEAIASWQQGVRAGTRVLDFGPKISIGVMTQKYWNQALEAENEQLFAHIAQDVCLWDQAACASMQVLYVQAGVDIRTCMAKLAQGFEDFALARGELTGDEQVEILKHVYRNIYHAADHDIMPQVGRDFQIIFDKDKNLSASPLNRTLLVKEFSDPQDLSQTLAPYRYNLQTCALMSTQTERREYSDSLVEAGVKRLTQAGQMLSSETGAPHDGKFGLSELVYVINRDPELNELEQFCQEVAATTPFFAANQGKPWQQWPLMEAADVALHGPGSLQPTLLNPAIHEGGQYFASGGTTGAPKYAFYTNSELDQVAELLAHSFRQLGIASGTVVANLFVAANMWSSFTVVQMALQKCGALQLPIGGQCDASFMQEFFDRFRPQVVFGIPSMLSELSKKIAAKVETVFYAGEMLTSGLAQALRQNWQVQNFYSAGYASVDVGLIGYQVPGGAPGENYLFDGIYLEEIDQEAVVTSTHRKSMPIIRYRTQDRIEILERSPRVKFKLLGRKDQTIFIWSARIGLAEIQKAFLEHDLPPPLQVQLRFNPLAQDDDLILISDGAVTSSPALLGVISLLYDSCQDLRQTIARERALARIHLKSMDELIVNERTGKCAKLLDLREF